MNLSSIFAATRRAIVLAAATAFSTASIATTYTVTNTNDSGPGSLRKAITDANGTSINDFVVFASGVSGQIDLQSELAITSKIVITGPGADILAIDGGDETRLITLDCPSSADECTITGLTFRNGRCPENESGGGLLLKRGTVTLQDCAITGCDAPYSGTESSFGGGLCAYLNVEL